jgi:NADH dehydrogenase
MEEIRAIDVVSRRVLTGKAHIPYDYLIIATGATHSYFGHEAWAPFAPGLKGIDDATLTRRRILLAFEQAEVSGNDDERQRLLTFVIVGAGPTGVEMAGALAEITRQSLPPDFRRIDPRATRIVLIEAGPRILPALPERLAAYAEKVLRRTGVEVLTSSLVTKCDRKGVEAGGRFLNAATIIWAAGVVASPVATWLRAPSDKAGRVLVEQDLSVPGHAAVYRAPNQLVPGLAAAAKQMGRYVGRVIAARTLGTSSPPPFHYRHQGDLATIGWRSAVVNLKHFQLTGLLGWLFWSVVHIYFLMGVRSRFIVAFSWAWQYLTFQRGARLITGMDSSAASDATPNG